MVLKKQQDDVRNYKIDWLRCIGIILVIAAHAGLPDLIRELRTFDVCLLVFISGMSQELSHRNQGDFYYLLKRLKKLVIPAYFIMTLLFLGTGYYCYYIGTLPIYSLKNYVYTLLLTNKGMGYTWIIKIFLMVSLFAPMISKYSRKISHLSFTIISSVICICYCFVCWVYLNYVQEICNGLTDVLIKEYLLGGIAYLIVASYGIRCMQFQSYKKWAIVISAFAFLIMQMMIGTFIPSEYKYPPGLYYISYGVVVSVVLYSIIPTVENKMVTWVSKNSYNIYIYHIIFLIVFDLLESVGNIPVIFESHMIRFAVFLTGSIGLVKLKNIIEKI